MNRNLIYICVLLLLIGCEQYFVPDVDTQSSCYVFEGVLTNIEGSHIIKISRSQSVNQDSLKLSATGFEVFIESDDGTIYDTREKYPGTYYTRAFQKGSPGHKYRMVAYSPEGKKYCSRWELMSKAAPIDSVYGTFSTQEVLLYNETAGYYGMSTRGINLHCNSATQGYSVYNRYEFEVVYQSVQTYPTFPFSTTYYVARPAFSVNSDFVSVSNGANYSNGNIIGHGIGFLPETRMDVLVTIPEIEIDESGDEIFEKEQIDFYQTGLLLRLKQMSLSERGYLFWDAVAKQKQANGQIFDPVQSQITGNVYCESDSTEVAFGYFGASCISEKSIYMKLKSKDTVEMDTIIYFPDLSRIITKRTPPDFWVYY